MSRPLKRLAVVWARLGPYHLARLRALDARCRAEGAALTAVEVAAGDAVYPWRREDGAEPFRRVTTLAGTAEAAAPAEIRAAVTAALDAADPDAVAFASYATPDARAALAWCRRRRRAAVVMFDSRAEDAPRTWAREAVKRVLVAQADAALVAGTPQAAYLRSLGMPAGRTFRPIDVVDNDHFRRGAQAVRQPDAAPSFLSVGRLVPRKNVGLLLDAYRLYRERSPAPWPLVVVGDGPERPALAARAGEGVAWAGALQIDELPAAYGRAGCFVHPAAIDPWGLVVNEAMAAGLPVLVSTGAGCAPDLVRGNGWTFPPDDPAALAELLARVAALSPADRAVLGRRSQAVIAEYTPETFADALWRAARAGLAVADRPASWPGRAVLAAFRLAARRHDSFHTVDA